MVEGAFDGQPFTAMLFTIENLGKVDTMAGNLSAQRIIQSIAEFLKDRLGPSSWSGRFGVNQIMCVVPRMDRTSAGRFLDQLSGEMEALRIFQPWNYPGVCINFSVWVGLAEGTPGVGFRKMLESLWSDEKKLAQLVCGNSPQDLQ